MLAHAQIDDVQPAYIHTYIVNKHNLSPNLDVCMRAHAQIDDVQSVCIYIYRFTFNLSLNLDVCMYAEMGDVQTVQFSSLA